MSHLPLVVFILFIILSLMLNIFGLMNLMPLYVTSPLLFLAIFLLIYFISDRKRFKGF